VGAQGPVFAGGVIQFKREVVGGEAAGSDRHEGAEGMGLDQTKQDFPTLLLEVGG
jgi:acyl dehydratase